jgi:hypothetical protein
MILALVNMSAAWLADRTYLTFIEPSTINCL